MSVATTGLLFAVLQKAGFELVRPMALQAEHVDWPVRGATVLTAQPV